jgi:hypothetical protein
MLLCRSPRPEHRSTNTVDVARVWLSYQGIWKTQQTCGPSHHFLSVVDVENRLFEITNMVYGLNGADMSSTSAFGYSIINNYQCWKVKNVVQTVVDNMGFT